MFRGCRLSFTFLTFAFLLIASGVQAAQPSSGTLSASNPTVTWRGGPFTVGVPSPLGCLGPSDPLCDVFYLTVELTAGYRFTVAITPEIAEDAYDLYIYYPDGTLAGHSANAGGNESVVIQHTNAHGSGPYQVRVLPFAVTKGASYQGVASVDR